MECWPHGLGHGPQPAAPAGCRNQQETSWVGNCTNRAQAVVCTPLNPDSKQARCTQEHTRERYLLAREQAGAPQHRPRSSSPPPAPGLVSATRGWGRSTCRRCQHCSVQAYSTPINSYLALICNNSVNKTFV